MRRLSLTEYAELAEVVAAISVVVSLVYFSVQLKANTAAVRSASVQAITNSSLEVLGTQAADAELARIRLLGNQDPGALNPDEFWRYNILYRQVWLTFQNVYLQRKLGVIGDDVWSTYARIICSMPSPGVMATWPFHAEVLNSDFVAFVEACPKFKELHDRSSKTEQ